MSDFKVFVKLTVPEKGKKNETKTINFESNVLDIRYENGKPVFLIYSEKTGFALISSDNCKVKKESKK